MLMLAYICEYVKTPERFADPTLSLKNPSKVS